MFAKRELRFINNIEDFKMPYKIYGEFDKKIMLEKYNNLTNKPNSYLHVRNKW